MRYFKADEKGEKALKKVWKNRYQILEEKGNGGNGKVYRIWDLHLEKEWAMKILEEKTPWGCEQGNKERIDELAALKKISHPNFPRIVDAFEEEDKSILIMDYIRGITLEEMIEKGPVREEEIISILLQICDAILYLHQSTPALLYLDLKPANIMLEENMHVRMVDLGSVSIKGKRGKISGSFGYASPEQVKIQREGSLLNEQSDIFSFGMVMYAMATGKCTKLPVVDGKSRYGVRIREEYPFLSVYLEKILEKCTRGNRERRYASMREVRKELENWSIYLKKRRKNFWKVPNIRLWNKTQWYQEKSIFCTEGRHSFYIAKKIMVLAISICCIMPGKMIWAEESEGIEREQELGVIIRDDKNRKVLVREGCAYGTDSNIFLEIPWKEIEGDWCKIMVECEDARQERKYFLLECIYRK